MKNNDTANHEIRQDDDSDMKIALPNAASQSLPEEDVRRTLAEMEWIRQQGILQQAEQVGSHMAAMAVTMPTDPDENVYHQKQFLFVFAVTVGCDYCIHDSVIARAVINTFHDRFRDACPDLYENSGYSIALSFYYLAVRSSQNSEGEIARTFAMLCGDEQNQEYQQMALEIYEVCLNRMRHLCTALKGQGDEQHGQ